MDQGKGAHNRNQNVRFDVAFLAKSKIYLGTGSANKGYENLLAERS